MGLLAYSRFAIYTTIRWINFFQTDCSNYLLDFKNYEQAEHSYHQKCNAG
jgi:hypothetical protein